MGRKRLGWLLLLAVVGSGLAWFFLWPQAHPGAARRAPPASSTPATAGSERAAAPRALALAGTATSRARAEREALRARITRTLTLDDGARAVRAVATRRRSGRREVSGGWIDAARRFGSAASVHLALASRADELARTGAR